MLRLVVALMLVGGLAHAERRVVTETAIDVIRPIHFEGATARLSPQRSTQDMLDVIAETFIGNPSILKIEVRAYGSDAKYQRGLLGSQRARALVVALVDRGVAVERLVARGFGGPRPGESSDPAFLILARERERSSDGLLQKR